MYVTVRALWILFRKLSTLTMVNWEKCGFGQAKTFFQQKIPRVLLVLVVRCLEPPDYELSLQYEQILVFNHHALFLSTVDWC